MKKIAIVDIGSNTVVLNLYTKDREGLHLCSNTSNAVRLVSYIDEEAHHMKPEGIQAACNVLSQYRQAIDAYRPDCTFAFITEPARNIDNRKEMLAAFHEAGIDVDAISGQQEATYDFFGSRIDTGDIKTGNAFDVGGGSTELIAFQNNGIVEAASMPLGCVRLSRLPLEECTADDALHAFLEDHPKLMSIPSSTLIGIGGTNRAAGLVMNEMFHCGNTMNVQLLEQVFQHLKDNDPRYIDAVHKVVRSSRWPVFLPGLNMILGICRAYHASEIRISSGCVREGYILSHLPEESHGSAA